jgi:calcineurin-like phosphoesterase family protein
MKETFLIADTHFGHRGVCHFLNADGSKLRPWTDPAQMDNDMVDLWNSVVGPKDKVYHLGDVVINRKALSTLSKLNGDKILIKGNHDIFKLSDYVPYFRDIRAYHVLDNMILSHVPIHGDSKGRFKANIHGHLHSRKLSDPWYKCVSVEQIGFKPIAFNVVREMLKSST